MNSFIRSCANNARAMQRSRPANTNVRSVYNGEAGFLCLEIVLHATPVVRVYLEDNINAISLFHGGFKTAVTMRRMNFILGHGTSASPAPCTTPYSVFRQRSQWYIRDDISMTTVPWEGGDHFIISPKYNVGYATDRIPSGWLNE